MPDQYGFPTQAEINASFGNAPPQTLGGLGTLTPSNQVPAPQPSFQSATPEETAAQQALIASEVQQNAYTDLIYGPLQVEEGYSYTNPDIGGESISRSPYPITDGGAIGEAGGLLFIALGAYALRRR